MNSAKTKAAYRIFFGAALFLLAIGPVKADENVGVLTSVKGKVEIFSNPAKKATGSPPHALYEGLFYSVDKAKLGQKIKNGYVVRTMDGAQARVVFNNGDQFNVGPGTAYKINWGGSSGAGTKLKLFYGKLRAVVAKRGPRSKMQIKTPTATAGVRGTDFYVETTGQKAQTNLSVLRGSVDVSPEGSQKHVKVESGQVARVNAQLAPPKPAPGEPQALPEKKEPPKIEVRKTTKEELVAIQQVSKIKVEPKVKEALPASVKAEIDKLENKAVENTVADIKSGDPKLYAQIKDKKAMSVDELNTAQVAEVFKEAPKDPGSLKPPSLEDLDEDVYDKYFKVDK